MKKTILQTTIGAGLLAFASSASAAIVFVSFTNGASSKADGTTATFNNLNSAQAGAYTLNDSSGTASGASITITTAPGGGNGSGSSGPTSYGSTSVTGAAAAAGFTQAMGVTAHFTSGTNTAVYTFTGLDLPAVSNYIVTVFGSRNATDLRTTKYTLSNGTLSPTQNLAVSTTGGPNTTNVASFSSIAASGTGTLTFSFADNGSGTAFGYLNAIKIESVAVPEPTSAMLLGSVGLLGLLRRRRA